MPRDVGSCGQGFLENLFQLVFGVLQEKGVHRTWAPRIDPKKALLAWQESTQGIWGPGAELFGARCHQELLWAPLFSVQIHE